MVKENRFPRPSLVFLDGDQEVSDGCLCLPGEDAPERVVFTGLAQRNWGGVSDRIGRNVADTIDACANAMMLPDHHDWVNTAANKLVLGGDVLWQALSAQWAHDCLGDNGRAFADAILDKFNLPRRIPNL